MFRRKKGDNDDDTGLPDRADDLGIPLKPGPRPPSAVAPARLPPVSAVPHARPAELPRRSFEPMGSSMSPAPVPAKPREPEARRLIVGRDISLSGEITSCDQLVVEGSVEANLANCREIEIAESGLFKGAASITEAEIRGRFEGTLTVSGRLLIRATGKVTGAVRYGQIEIECGGQVSGDVQAETSPAAATERPRTTVAAPGDVRV